MKGGIIILNKIIIIETNEWNLVSEININGIIFWIDKKIIIIIQFIYKL